LPAHDPRALFSSALAYATANRGACHLQALSYPVEISLAMPDLGFPEPLDRFSTDRKGELVARMQHLVSLQDSLKVCKFAVCGGGGVEPHTLVEWLNLTTEQADTLPARLLSEPRPDGGAAGRLPPLDEMLKDYYQFRGWDASGRPTRAKLAELGLD